MSTYGFCPTLVATADQTLLSSQAFFMTWDDHEVVNDLGPGADERDGGVCESSGRQGKSHSAYIHLRFKSGASRHFFFSLCQGLSSWKIV